MRPGCFSLFAPFLRSSAYKAIHAAIDITKKFAEDDDSLPLNVAMEMRFTKHSDSPLSPAYGKEVSTHRESSDLRFFPPV